MDNVDVQFFHVLTDGVVNLMAIFMIAIVANRVLDQKEPKKKKQKQTPSTYTRETTNVRTSRK